MKSLLEVRLAERRMTQRELAHRCEVDENTVWVWTTDKGAEGLSLRRLEQIAKALSCKITELFEEE
ncbi:helix-turn-helix transcriptional regulator [Leptogranulimonas caecicola]|uniref:helix-turn-helix domain-containing protein n=1 Tax=Leptogranulimonas caecicola TaxID=2894156 RepID=UPI00351842D6